MKSANLLNEHPPFLKGLSVPEVVVFTSFMTVLGIVIGVMTALFFQTATPFLLGLLGGLSAILWLPKNIANRVMKWRAGKPTGWLYQRIDCMFYRQKYTTASGLYQNKKEQHHDR